MADLLIKGINELTAPHDIHISNGGLNGEKCNFSSWDSSVGCAYEVVELSPHGRLVDADKLLIDIMDRNIDQAQFDDYSEFCHAIHEAPTVIEASEE